MASVVQIILSLNNFWRCFKIMNWLFFVFILAIPQLSGAQNGKPVVNRDLSEFSERPRIRPRAGVLIQIQNQWNRIELPEGNFSTHLMRMNANTQFNPWISVANNVQYDTVSGVLGWQSRLRWIVRPGNDVYVVYTHNWINNLAGGAPPITGAPRQRSCIPTGSRGSHN